MNCNSKLNISENYSLQNFKENSNTATFYGGEMIFDGTSYDTIESGLSTILNIDANRIKDIILNFMNKAEKDQHIEMDIFREQCYSFIKKNKVDYIDKVYVYHLGRHIGIPDELMPLPKLLNTENSMTEFLKKRNLKFKYRTGKIIILYCDKEISENEIYDEKRFENHCRLAKRLGYFNTKDFCVNGFAFAANIKNDTNNYFAYLYHGPELLRDIDELLDTQISAEYFEISKYYLFSLEESLENIIFDSKENLKDNSEKEIYYLYECMLYLHAYYAKKSFGLHNPIIRFSEDKSVNIKGYREL